MSTQTPPMNFFLFFLLGRQRLLTTLNERMKGGAWELLSEGEDMKKGVRKRRIAIPVCVCLSVVIASASMFSGMQSARTESLSAEVPASYTTHYRVTLRLRSYTQLGAAVSPARATFTSGTWVEHPIALASYPSTVQSSP